MSKDLREALSGMNSSMSDRPTGPQNDDAGEEENIGGGAPVAVHYHDHKESGKHSVHKISGDGNAKSESHSAGQGGDTCPLCGGSGEVQK